MAFASGKGFQVVEGPNTVRWSVVSSTASFDEGAPVALSDVGTRLIEVDSGTTFVYGVALSASGVSLGGALVTRIPMTVPTAATVFEAPVPTAATAANLAIGSLHAVETNAGIARLAASPSAASGQCILVERGTSGLAYDSAQSSVYCQFLGDKTGIFGSNASGRYGP